MKWNGLRSFQTLRSRVWAVAEEGSSCLLRPKSIQCPTRVADLPLLICLASPTWVGGRCLLPAPVWPFSKSLCWEILSSLSLCRGALCFLSGSWFCTKQQSFFSLALSLPVSRWLPCGTCSLLNAKALQPFPFWLILLPWIFCVCNFCSSLFSHSVLPRVRKSWPCGSSLYMSHVKVQPSISCYHGSDCDKADQNAGDVGFVRGVWELEFKAGMLFMHLIWQQTCWFSFLCIWEMPRGGRLLWLLLRMAASFHNNL